MGHSITVYKQKNMISKDYKIEIWFRYVCQEIEKMEEPTKVVNRCKKRVEGYGKQLCSGYIYIELEKFLLDKEKENLFIKICEAIYRELEQFKDTIPKEIINTLAGYKKGEGSRSDVKTELYLSYGRTLIKLIHGEQKEEVVYI